MLFVGGHLHGQDLDIPDPPPPLHHDLASGEAWGVFPCRLIKPDPITGQPGVLYIRPAYVHEAILNTNDQKKITTSIHHAILQWWLLGGIPQPITPANGHGATYAAACTSCGTGPQLFGSLKDRAAWLAAHVEAGHVVEFSQPSREETTP